MVMNKLGMMDGKLPPTVGDTSATSFIVGGQLSSEHSKRHTC
jgi:hypothetical protein